jgi:glutamyl-tRNA synthetase
LKNISEKVLHALSFSVVKKRFDTFDLGGLDAEALWLAIRNNISEFQEISDWVDILNGYVAPLANPEDQEFLKVAFSVLPAFPWGGDTWNQWTQKVKEVTGRNGRELYLPLRMRLTGRKNGPEMQHLMPLFQKPIIEIT